MRILVYTKNGKPSKNAWDASWIGLYSCGCHCQLQLLRLK